MHRWWIITSCHRHNLIKQSIYCIIMSCLPPLWVQFQSSQTPVLFKEILSENNHKEDWVSFLKSYQYFIPQLALVWNWPAGVVQITIYNLCNIRCVCINMYAFKNETEWIKKGFCCIILTDISRKKAASLWKAPGQLSRSVKRKTCTCILPDFQWCRINRWSEVFILLLLIEDHTTLTITMQPCSGEQILLYWGWSYFHFCFHNHMVSRKTSCYSNFKRDPWQRSLEIMIFICCFDTLRQFKKCWTHGNHNSDFRSVF